MTEISKIADLTPDKENARRHNERNVGMIVDALHEVGAARSIVIDEDGLILAGNATIEAAAVAGIERVQVVDADGETIIAVRRTGLTAEAKKRLALYDNRTAELADWNPDQLLADLEGGLDLSGLFGRDELDELLKGLGPEPPEDKGPRLDEGEALAELYGVELGQVWSLGEHRLAVGDCTDRAVVDAVMRGEKAAIIFADPPFGISYTGHGASKDGRANKFSPIIGDEIPNADWLQFCTLEYGAIYLKTHWDVLEFWKNAVTRVAKVKSIIVWDRCSHSAGDVIGGYATQSELVIFGVFDNHKLNKFDTDVWRIERATIGAPEQRTGHPYESPIALPQRAIENSTQIGNIVYDPFVGSGTTLIACERLNRRCRAIEIHPPYAAVTIQRWVDMVGGEPRLIE